MSDLNSEVFTVMTELLPAMQEYQDLKPKFIKIKVEKFSDGSIIKIKSDEIGVCEALGKIMLMMAKFSTKECKIQVEEEDHR